MKRSRLIIIVCILSLALSGCKKSRGIYSNYREIEQLQLIQTLGIDGSPGALTVSVSSGKPLGGGTPVIISRSASSISSAIDLLQDYASQEQLYYAHLQYIVIGEEAAKSGVGGVLDYVERNMQIRISTPIIIASGCTAKELITGPGDADYDVTQALDSVKRDTDLTGYSHVFTCLETARALAESGVALAAAVSAVDTNGVVFMKPAGTTAVPAGYAVLKDGKLVDIFDGGAAVAASLMTGNAGTAGFSVDDGEGGSVTLELESGQAAVRPVWSDGGLDRIMVEVTVNAGIAELEYGKAEIMTGSVRSRLKQALAKKVKENIELLLERSKACDADFLGLGEQLRRDDPKAYEALPEDWLKSARFDVTVKAEIKHSYELGDPVSVDGGEKK